MFEAWLYRQRSIPTLQERTEAGASLSAKHVQRSLFLVVVLDSLTYML